MAKYANCHLNIFIPVKYLKTIQILKTIPVPTNLQEVKQMDEFMAQLLRGKHQKVLLHQDAIYRKIQRKNMDVMGPLCKLRKSLEIVNKERCLSVSFNDLLKLVTQSIMLLGQSNIARS